MIVSGKGCCMWGLRAVTQHRNNTLTLPAAWSHCSPHHTNLSPSSTQLFTELPQVQQSTWWSTEYHLLPCKYLHTPHKREVNRDTALNAPFKGVQDAIHTPDTRLPHSLSFPARRMLHCLTGSPSHWSLSHGHIVHPVPDRQRRLCTNSSHLQDTGWLSITMTTAAPVTSLTTITHQRLPAAADFFLNSWLDVGDTAWKQAFQPESTQTIDQPLHKHHHKH